MEDLNKGKWQYIEYENVPAYCPYCKHQGQMINECTVKVRDEEFHQRKEPSLKKGQEECIKEEV